MMVIPRLIKLCDLDIYPEPILKEECINHVHKRMGTALINLGKQKKLGGKGFGRLTKREGHQIPTLLPLGYCEQHRKPGCYERCHMGIIVSLCEY